MTKKITLLVALLIATVSYGQTLANNFITGLESPNTCDITFNKQGVLDNTITITTNSKEIQYFNVSWIFKGDDTKNKKVPGTSQITDIMDISASTTGFSVDGLNTTADTGVISLGTAPCVSVVGAKILASIKFTGFNDDAGLTTATLSVTTNPSNALGDATKYLTETFTVVINYDETASIDDLKKFNFSYAPNPTKDFVRLTAASSIKTVKVFNLLGQEVLQATYNSRNPSIDISDLTAGVYVMKVAIDDSIGTFRIIKE